MARKREYVARGPRRSRLDVDRRALWRGLEKGSAKATEGRDCPRANGGDGTSFGGKFLRECKSTSGLSLSVKLDWLQKLAAESGAAGMQPVLVLGFEAEYEKASVRWACVPFELFVQMARAWIQDGGECAGP